MKLVFVSPTYGPVDPQALRSQRAAIMHAASHGHIWAGDASPDKMKFDVSRNASCQAVLKAGIELGVEAAFWCDSDIILPVDAITRLANRGLDFVTGIYFQRNGEDSWPLVANFNGTSFQWLVHWPKDVVAPIDGCGFGCVLTSVKMLNAIEEHWFSYAKYSEDFDFCLKAKEKGFQLHVDTGVLCGHLADARPVTIDDFKKKHPEFWGEEKPNGNFTGGKAGEVGLPEPYLERQDNLHAEAAV